MIQIRKFAVSFGDSISFLSIAEAYSLGLWSDTAELHSARQVRTSFDCAQDRLRRCVGRGKGWLEQIQCHSHCLAQFSKL